MSNPYTLARKYLAAETPNQPGAHEEGAIQAIKIFSQVLDAEIWLILDRRFIPTDGLAAYYPDRKSVV